VSRVGAAPHAAVAAVHAAVAAVTDPEYPDVTIRDLGILERVEVDEGPDGADGSDGTAGLDGSDARGELRVRVSLVPTVLGCPALAVIEADVVAAAKAAGAEHVEVVFLTTPRWTTDRIRPTARRHLARELTVAIRGRGGGVTCPVCGSTAVRHHSDFGPSLCREIWWCGTCRNPVEVLRS
jgi:ring-1,2-phenylacetyl-CoA epoxidase subunit PaaD